jgi:3-hydroxyacyl-CoA dehydrogenase
MRDPVQLARDGSIAIITLDNPPVNALSRDLLRLLGHAIESLEADDQVEAIVVCGEGRNFCAGADIREFERMMAGREPGPRFVFATLLSKIEDARKPFVMALHGAVFGGGLELAMAGHYRMAAAGARLAQPEVKLGMIPGAGGTQRLPRLVGIAKAIEICAEGSPIDSRDAMELGLVDRLVEKDLLDHALGFAREMATLPVPRTRELKRRLGTPAENLSLFAAAREVARRKHRGMSAPLAAIEAIEAAAKLPLKEGLQLERKLFTGCFFSSQSKALVHLFNAERQASRIPEDAGIDEPSPLRHVGIVGAGTMGQGIAMALADAGIPVLLKDLDQETLERGIAALHEASLRSVAKGRLTQESFQNRLKLISGVQQYEDLADADLVIEAVFENLAAKKQVFQELDRVSKSTAILATNTSSLDLDEVASVTGRPESVVGAHFFHPANIMRALEVVRGKATGTRALATCMQLARRLGKAGVIVGNCSAFVGNRIFAAYRREAQFLVEEGTAPDRVDQVLYDFGMPMGPLAAADLAGLDIAFRIRRERRSASSLDTRQPFVEDALVERRRWGRKTGAGWYLYGEDHRATPDPELAGWISRLAAERGILQRSASPEEIVERCIYAMINEGARILADGYAARASDVDLICVHGFGFPAFHGGPMWYADTIGLREIYAKLCSFRQAFGELWEPTPLLQQLAEQAIGFAGFDNRLKQASQAHTIVAAPRQEPNLTQRHP